MRKLLLFVLEVFCGIMIMKIIQKVRRVRIAKKAERSRIFADIGNDEMVEDSFDPIP